MHDTNFSILRSFVCQMTWNRFIDMLFQIKPCLVNNWKLFVSLAEHKSTAIFKERLSGFSRGETVCKWVAILKKSRAFCPLTMCHKHTVYLRSFGTLLLSKFIFNLIYSDFFVFVFCVHFIHQRIFPMNSLMFHHVSKHSVEKKKICVKVSRCIEEQI